jgi:hypothetical protein
MAFDVGHNRIAVDHVPVILSGPFGLQIDIRGKGSRIHWPMFNLLVSLFKTFGCWGIKAGTPALGIAISSASFAD